MKSSRTLEIRKTDCKAKKRTRRPLRRICSPKPRKKVWPPFNEAVRRAEEEVKRLVDEADRQAEEQAVKLSSDTLKEQDEIRRRAESRLDEAAGLIVERIVNG